MHDPKRYHRRHPSARALARSDARPDEGSWPGLVALVTMLLLLWAPGLAGQTACGTSVTVRSGDTLAGIAARCNTTVSALARANDQIENPDLIRVGWVLTIPSRVEQASPEPEPEEPERDVRRGTATTHTVRSGETLAIIAGRFDTTVRALVRANSQIEDPDLIRVGWVLTIPGTGEQPVERPPRRDPGETYPNAAVRVERERAAPGETMQLSARGLPADHRVNVGVGPWRSEYSVVREARTDREGRLVTPVQMPDWADPGDRFVFVVEISDHDLKVMTDPIVVVRPDERPGEPRPDLEAGQRVRITGTLTDEGVECQALRSENDDLFTLAGMPEGFERGDRVQVVGTVAEVSFCQQGITLEVREMARVDEDFGNLEPVVRVEGRLTDEGVECQALRSESGELYTLVGNLEGFHMGQDVYVEGTEVEVSVCQQGTTLDVRVIRERGPRPGS